VVKNDGLKNPYPVFIPGRGEPVLSHKVEDYVNAEFFYYYNFYTSCRRAGPPFAGGWTEWPSWVPQLLAAFDTIIESDRINSERKFMAQLHGCRMV